jgi:hypothetical protein
MSNNVIVGSIYNVSIIGCGNALLNKHRSPLTQNNVLHVTKIIKNLIFVRKLTIDNDVSVEFDPFSFL